MLSIGESITYDSASVCERVVQTVLYKPFKTMGHGHSWCLAVKQSRYLGDAVAYGSCMWVLEFIRHVFLLPSALFVAFNVSFIVECIFM